MNIRYMRRVFNNIGNRTLQLLLAMDQTPYELQAAQIRKIRSELEVLREELRHRDCASQRDGAKLGFPHSTEVLHHNHAHSAR